MEKEIISKYIVVANGYLIDPFGLKVKVKDQFIKFISRGSKPSYVGNDFYHDKHCIFTEYISEAHQNETISGANEFVERCKKLHEGLKFEVYNLKIEYSCHNLLSEDPKEYANEL